MGHSISQETKSIMVTWERIPLTEKTFIPKIFKSVKTILLQDFLIVFNYNGDLSEKIVAFDLKEKRWLQTKISGETLDLNPENSICIYGDDKIIMFGTSLDGEEDILNLLSFKKSFNEMHIEHKLTRFQDRLLKSRHSANVFKNQLFLYGGYTRGVLTGDLSVFDMNTSEVTPKCTLYGQGPGILYDHSSISRSHRGYNGIYIYGGEKEDWTCNRSIYLLDIQSRCWMMIYTSEKVQGLVQIHEDKIYILGGGRNNSRSHLSIYNISKNVEYEIARKGDIPPSSDGGFSTIYENKMLVFGGVVYNNGQHLQDVDQIHSLDLDFKPVDGLIQEMVLDSTFSFEEESKDPETLQQVQKLIEQNKEHDITFNVQNKEIPAHKEILSVRSSYFKKMFSSGMQESYNKEIILDEISAQSFEALLEYFYKGILPSSEAILKELIVYSEKILLERLRIHCERTLINQITKENATELYMLSKRSKAEELRETAMKFMANNLSYFADQLASLWENQSEQKKETEAGKNTL